MAQPLEAGSQDRPLEANPPYVPSLSRRGFLKYVGALGATVILDGTSLPRFLEALGPRHEAQVESGERILELPEYSLTGSESQAFLETLPNSLLEENIFSISYSSVENLFQYDPNSEFGMALEAVRGFFENLPVSIEFGAKRLGDGRFRLSAAVFKFRQEQRQIPGFPPDVVAPVNSLYFLDPRDLSPHVLFSVPIPDSSTELSLVTQEFAQTLSGRLISQSGEVPPPDINSWVLAQKTTQENQDPNKLVVIIGGNVAYPFSRAYSTSGNNLRIQPTVTPETLVGQIDTISGTDFFLQTDPSLSNILPTIPYQLLPEGSILYTTNEQGEKWYLMKRQDGSFAFAREDAVAPILWEVRDGAPDAPPSVPYGRARVEGTIETEGLDVTVNITDPIRRTGTININGEENPINPIDYFIDKTREFGMREDFGRGWKQIQISGIVVGQEQPLPVEIDGDQVMVNPLIIAVPMKRSTGQYTGEVMLIRVINQLEGRLNYIAEITGSGDNYSSAIGTVSTKEFLGWTNPGDQIYIQVFSNYDVWENFRDQEDFNNNCDNFCQVAIRMLNIYGGEANRVYREYSLGRNIHGITTIGEIARVGIDLN